MKDNEILKFPLREELINLLQEELPLHSVYVISFSSEIKRQEIFLTPKCNSKNEMFTYTLLIIGFKSPSKNLSEFMEELYVKTKQGCRVNIIFHTLSNIKERIEIGDNFLTRIISQTPCMYKMDNALYRFSRIKLFFHSSIYKRIKKEWKSRIHRADYLLAVVNTNDEKKDANSKLAVMHFALEQVCLSLLLIFWEYKPHFYSLSYLMQLCSHFTELPNKVFPKTTFGLQRQFYMLCNAQHILRFKVTNEFSNKDADKVYKLCLRFYKESKILGKIKLEQLKKLHHPEAVHN
ncbi:hypothetical protein [Cellulophaga sp. Hel_I_12]|uniref:hypothetical protein n=1 Tax=Cellulophaga sp. Hel_I_12 TaxID=1249972 RepID=UPI000647282A|nr:hypothetical protein [Cellulophaga sp. Hel_I_12]